MTLSEDLAWRGLIKDKSFDNNEWLDKPGTFYHGYDGSAPSLTVGNLAAILLDIRFIKAGWKPVILLGSGTTMVGDPGGKIEERQLMSRAAIDKNIANLKKQVTALFGEDD